MIGSDIEVMPGEEMVIASNPHWFYFWKQVAAGVGVIGLLLLMWAWDVSWLDTILGWLIVLALVVLVVNTIYAFIQWRTTRFAVTSERVAYQSGIFRRTGVSIPLNRINNVNFHQSFIARLLDNGVVVIESAGETGDSVFENIPHPEEVRTTIFQQVAADEQRDSDRNAASLAKAMQDKMPPPAAGPGADERLHQLDELRAKGLVNDEEYARKRQQILDEL
jgi:uncharacterized membrane protein YdbT with pleckstrin-like domain